MTDKICPCLCHDPKTRFLPSEFIPCCPSMGQKFRIEIDPEISEGFAGDDICAACDGTGTVEDRICKDCGGKVYR